MHNNSPGAGPLIIGAGPTSDSREKLREELKQKFALAFVGDRVFFGIELRAAEHAANFNMRPVTTVRKMFDELHEQIQRLVDDANKFLAKRRD